MGSIKPIRRHMVQQAEEDYGCYPWDQIKKAHDRIHDGTYPEEPPNEPSDELMRPQQGEPED
jgi:hypothetical protein